MLTWQVGKHERGANMADLLRDLIRIIGLAHLPSFSVAVPPLHLPPSLPHFKANYSASDYYGMQWLRVSHRHGNGALSLPYSNSACLSESSSSSLCFCL